MTARSSELTTDVIESPAAQIQGPALPPYAGFGAALRAWLRRAGRSQKELAGALAVSPSAVAHWMQGQKRPDARSLVKLLATFHGWFRADWDPLEALDAATGLGYSWSKIEEALGRHFQPGGMYRPSGTGGRRPALRHAGSSSPRVRSSTRPAASNTI